MKKVYEIGVKDKNGIQVRLGDIIMHGMKDNKGKVSGWSKEIVTFAPNDKEVVVTPYKRKQEFMQMQTDSDCIEILG